MPSKLGGFPLLHRIIESLALLMIASMVGFIASRSAGFTTAFCFDATGGRATY